MGVTVVINVGCVYINGQYKKDRLAGILEEVLQLGRRYVLALESSAFNHTITKINQGAKKLPNESYLYSLQ